MEEEKSKSTGGGLFSSAKILGEAAQATYNKETDNIDKSKVAGASRELLGAASEYGHLKEKGCGQYVEKADDYLRQYETPPGSGSTPTTTETPPKPEEMAKKPETGDGGGACASGADPKPPEAGGAGDILKKAEGLFKF